MKEPDPAGDVILYFQFPRGLTAQNNSYNSPPVGPFQFPRGLTLQSGHVEDIERTLPFNSLED